MAVWCSTGNQRLGALMNTCRATLANSETKKARFSAERDKTIQAAKARIPELLRRVQAQKARQVALSSDIIPRARGVLKELEYVHRGLITMHLEKTLKSDRVLRDLRRT